MPKVYLTQAQRDRADAEKADDMLRVMVAAWKLKTGKTIDALAQQIGVSNQTLYRRIHSPEDFSIKELRRLATAIGLTKEQTQKCVI